MKSLFIISLPRSLSSYVYHLTAGSLGLTQPSWVSDGEILNLDRFILFNGNKNDTNLKFIRKESNPGIFAAAVEFLDTSVKTECFAYKDVINPFVISEYLQTRSFNVIKIKRNIADVAYAMLGRGWLYPRAAASSNGSIEYCLVEGLLNAWRVLDLVSGQVLEFDAIIYDSHPIKDALQRFYPQMDIQLLAPEDLSIRRDAVLARRSTVLYKNLEAIVAELTAKL